MSNFVLKLVFPINYLVVIENNSNQNQLVVIFGILQSVKFSL